MFVCSLYMNQNKSKFFCPKFCFFCCPWQIPLQIVCTAITVWFPFNRNTTISDRCVTRMPIKSWQCQIKGLELPTACWGKNQLSSMSVQCTQRRSSNNLISTFENAFSVSKKVLHPVKSATAFQVLTSYFLSCHANVCQ